MSVDRGGPLRERPCGRAELALPRSTDEHTTNAVGAAQEYPWARTSPHPADSDSRSGPIRLTAADLFGARQVPFVVYSQMFTQPTGTVAADSVKAIFITSGWTRIRLDGQEVQAQEGTVVVLPAGVPASGHPQGFTETTTLYLDPTFLDSNVRWLRQNHPLHRLLEAAIRTDRVPGTLQLPARGTQRVRSALATLSDNADDHLRERPRYAELAKLFDEVARIVGLQNPPPTPRRQPPRPEVVIAARLLRENLTYSWNIADLSSRVSLSASQLNRLFRDELGISPSAFLWQARLDRMADLLATGRVTASEAARLTGWQSATAASRAFRRRYGVSPHRFVVSSD